MTGRAKEILKPSADRIEPICPYYGECGGCQYQHLKYEKELEYKTQQVKEILNTIGGIKDFEFEGITPSESCYGYRNSITLHRSETGYGYVGKDNRTIIDIERCPLATDEINKVIPSLFGKYKDRNIAIKSDTGANIYISEDSNSKYFKNEFLGPGIKLFS